METKYTLDNLSTTERYIRVGISIAAIVAAMESSLGSGVFAAINVTAIAVAFTALIGWDPVRAGASYVKSQLQLSARRPAVMQGR
jgi:hypothetical protein